MSDDKKGHHADEEAPHYGTFQPAIGFPQLVPPPGATGTPDSHQYVQGYQAIPGYAVSEGVPVREPRLPCCGIGMGWLLFIAGFFLVAIPWYVAAFILFCAKVDHREKPGYVACTIAGVLALIAIVFGVTKSDL